MLVLQLLTIINKLSRQVWNIGEFLHPMLLLILQELTLITLQHQVHGEKKLENNFGLPCTTEDLKHGRCTGSMMHQS